MKSNIPWSVKGIDPEAREAAKIAARRAGMTLGEWLNSLILQSGELPEGFAQHVGALMDEDDVTGEEETLSGESSEAEDELQSRIDSLNRKLDPADRQALAVSGIDESIERLASTIESSRRMLGETAQKSIAELTQRVEWVQSRLEEVASQHRSGIDPKTLLALERAIAGVATHIEKSDRRNSELVQTVEDALSQLGSRVDSAESVASEAAGRMDLALDRLGVRLDTVQATTTEAVGRIDSSLDRLGGRIETAESEQRRSAARLNERLSQIDDRLAHSGVERETTLATIERRLAAFESKLQTVQSRVDTAAIARPNLPPDVMTRMEFEDWSRRQSIDAGADAASIKRSVATIEARLTGIMERIDRVRNETDGQIKDVERKAEDALRQGQAQAKTLDGQTSGAITDLRLSVDEIAQKFDRTNHTTTETMSALEGVLRSLTRRLDALEGRPAKPAAAPVPAAEPIPAPAPEPTAPPSGETALPKRPTWSWGVPQQPRPEPAAAPPPTQPAEKVETRAAPEAPSSVPPAAAPVAARAEDEPKRHGKPRLDDTFEVYEDVDDASGTSHVEDAEEVEVTFPPERPETGAVAAEESALDHDGHVDLSKLVFNLKAERESEPEGEAWHAEERVEPTIDVEAIEEQGPEPGTAWLDQARRAAKTASPSERVRDFVVEGEERSSTHALLIVAAVVVLLIAVGAVGWIFVRPWLAKSHVLGGAPATTSTTTPPAPGAAGAQASSIVPSTNAPQEPGFTPPSENDIGQPLPEGAETPSSQPPAATSGAPAPSQTPPARAAQGTAAPEQPAQPGSAAPSNEQASLQPQNQPTITPPISAQDALQAAASAGNARALYALALANKDGRGVAANPAQALTLMKQAADKNLAVAQRTLGIWYEQGDGVAKDVDQARLWYEKAAKNGDVQAMHNLGFFYAQGMGGLKKDGAEAEHWFKSAAERGLEASQVNLAIIYSQSATYGLPVQNDQAYFWSAVAAKRDPIDKDAPRIRDALAGALSPDVKSQLDEQVEKWKPQPVDLIANGGFDSSPDSFLPIDQQQPLTRAELTSVQESLIQLGFDAGNADGRPGGQTETAIKAFQSAYGLPQTGVANRDLMAALNAIPK